MEPNVGLLLEKTLAGLQARIISNQLFCQSEEGLIEMLNFTFMTGAKLSQINEFEEKHKLRLPPDYVKFLQFSNGAKLFYNHETEEGWHFFSLNEIAENLQDNTDFEENHLLPIASFIEGLLVIDVKKKTGDGYLYWLDESMYDDKLNLKSNFEIWFDRLIISQGTKFWYWPFQTIKNYYAN